MNKSVYSINTITIFHLLKRLLQRVEKTIHQESDAVRYQMNAFVIAGSTPKRVIVRGIGPSLALPLALGEIGEDDVVQALVRDEDAGGTFLGR